MSSCSLKTMKVVNVVSFEFVKDDESSCAGRTHEVKSLITQMISMSHKRGRPKENQEEVLNAA